MKRIFTLNMSREEWLKLRKNGIGGSDAGACSCDYECYENQ